VEEIWKDLGQTWTKNGIVINLNFVVCDHSDYISRIELGENYLEETRFECSGVHG